MTLAQIALRNIGRNRRRSVLSGVAIGVAAMAIVILFALMNGMQADLARNIQDFYSGMIRVRHPDYDRNEVLAPIHLRVTDAARRIDQIEAIPEVTAVSPRIDFPVTIYRDEETISAQGLGIDVAREDRFSDLSRYLVEGRLPAAGSREVVVGRGLASRLGAAIGDRITALSITMTRGSNAMTFTVVGLLELPVDTLNNQTLMVPLAEARTLVHMDGAVTELLVKVDAERDVNRVADELRALWADDEVHVVTWREIPTSYSFFEFARNSYNGLAFVFFLLGSTVIITTTMIVIFERMREIGTIAAMGMTGKQIVLLFFLESLFIAMVAAAIGAIIGTAISLVLSRVGIDMGAALEGIDLEISSKLYPVWTLRTTVFVWFYSVLVTGVASFFPSRRAARIEPVEALHTV